MQARDPGFPQQAGGNYMCSWVLWGRTRAEGTGFAQNEVIPEAFAFFSPCDDGPRQRSSQREFLEMRTRHGCGGQKPDRLAPRKTIRFNATAKIGSKMGWRTENPKMVPLALTHGHKSALSQEARGCLGLPVL